MQVPLTAWLDRPPDAGEAARGWRPSPPSWRPVPGVVEHGFTHFAARLTLVAARIDRRRADALEGVWCALDRLDGVALSTMMKKVIRHAERQGALGGGAPVALAQPSPCSARSSSTRRTGSKERRWWAVAPVRGQRGAGAPPCSSRRCAPIHSPDSAGRGVP